MTDYGTMRIAGLALGKILRLQGPPTYRSSVEQMQFRDQFPHGPTHRSGRPSARASESSGLNRLFEVLRRNEPVGPCLQRICDNAGLGLDEIAPGLPEVRSFDDRHDAFDPVGRDPSRDVICAQEAQRLLNSLLAPSSSPRAASAFSALLAREPSATQDRCCAHARRRFVGPTSCVRAAAAVRRAAQCVLLKYCCD
jgi:hypothetical protein